MTQFGPEEDIPSEFGQPERVAETFVSSEKHQEIAHGLPLQEVMKILDTIPEDDMVVEFLKAELESPRFASRYHELLLQKGIPANTDMATLDVETRKQLLWEVRPGLLKTLPKDIVWHEALLEKQDWDKVMYINEDDWKNFSNGTRLVLEGVEKLGQPHHEVLTERVSEITKQLQAGEQIPKIIMVAEPGLEKLVLLEGHARATAYASSGLYREKQIPAIVGTSKKAADWAWY